MYMLHIHIYIYAYIIFPPGISPAASPARPRRWPARPTGRSPGRGRDVSPAPGTEKRWGCTPGDGDMNNLYP